MKKILKTAILAFFIWGYLSNICLALIFQIDKGKIRIRMPAGWSDGGVINVTNRSEKPIKMRVYISDWVYSSADGSKNFMPPGTHPNSCSEWIKFYPADFIVPENGKEVVNYVVGIPPNTSGAYYAILFFEVEVGETAGKTEGTKVKVYNRLGSIFTVEVEGTVKRVAQVSNFNIKKAEAGFEATADFENSGNVDITAKGSIDIINEEGFVLARKQFNDIYTMPLDKAKLYVENMDADLYKGKYDAILTFDLEGGVLVKEYQIEVSGSGEILNIKEVE